MAEGQEQGQRVSAGFGSGAADKPGEPAAGLQKAPKPGGREHGHPAAGRKGAGWWCFSLSEEKKRDFQESLKCSLILDTMGV